MLFDKPKQCNNVAMSVYYNTVNGCNEKKITKNVISNINLSIKNTLYMYMFSNIQMMKNRKQMRANYVFLLLLLSAVIERCIGLSAFM